MPKRFDLLVFDWDGTLMDSAAAITASLRAACADANLPVPSEQDARYVIGLGMHDAMKYLLPDVPRVAYTPVLERYRHHFLLHDAQTTLFEGAAQALEEWRDAGFLLGVATGKSRRGLDRALEATGLKDCFHVTRCADEGHTKPDPGMLHWLMNEADVDASRTVMIGDTSHDLEMARAAEVAGIGVAYGAHPRENLTPHAPVACVESFAELRSWLNLHA